MFMVYVVKSICCPCVTIKLVLKVKFQTLSSSALVLGCRWAERHILHMSKNKGMEILIEMSSFSSSERKSTLHKKTLNIHCFFSQIPQVSCVSFQSEYAVQQGLGGVMIWSVETDDFLGNCHGMKYPLLTAINSVLFGGIIVSTIKNKIWQQYRYNLCCTCRSTNWPSPTNEHNSSSNNAS